MLTITVGTVIFGVIGLAGLAVALVFSSVLGLIRRACETVARRRAPGLELEPEPEAAACELPEIVDPWALFFRCKLEHPEDPRGAMRELYPDYARMIGF